MKSDDEKIAKIALLLGLGLDGTDGHTRITTGDNYYLLGGSEETHGVMQEKVIKFNEKLEERGKALEEIGPEELKEIAHELDMTD